MKGFLRKAAIASIFVCTALLCSCSAENSDYYTGTVENDRFDVSNEVAGIIKEIYVNEGDSVKKGDKIALIDVTSLEIALGQAKAELGSSKSTLDKAKSGYRAEEISKAQIQLNQQSSIIEGNKSKYENASQSYDRVRALYENDSASKQALEEAETALNVAKSNLDSSNSQYEYLAKQLELMQNGPQAEDVGIPQGKYESALWSIKSIENSISKKYVYANSDGIIESLNYLEGEYIPVFSSLAGINDTSTTWAKIYVEEKNLHKASIGNSVTVKADFLEDKTIQGKIVYISSEGEFTPKNVESKENKQEIVYEVKVEIPNENSMLKPGTLVDIYLDGDGSGKQ